MKFESIKILGFEQQMGKSQNYEKITLFYCPNDNEMNTLYDSIKFA